MALNTSVLNSHELNSDTGLFLGSGELISIEQNVVIESVGELVSIEQEVEFGVTTDAAESIINIEQTVYNTLTTDSLLSIEQRVDEAGEVSYLDKNGWDMVLTLGGYQVPRDQIHGTVSINRAARAAALCNFTLIPPTGIQDLDFYVGKTVTVDILTSNGTFRAYTGVVDIPIIDIIEEKITFECTDRRIEKINSQLANLVPNLGFYSDVIQGDFKDTAEQLELRLESVPFDLDFDAYGNPTYTAWAAKSTADYTLTDSDVYRERPQVEFASRGNLINSISISFQYRYERLYHTTRTFSWTSPIANDICFLLRDGYSLTNKEMVQQAVDAAGWPLRSPITFTDVWPSGWYRCNGVNLGWSLEQWQGTSEPVVDVNGNQLSDASGNALSQACALSVVDYSDLYCMGAQWSAAQQWTQSVTENYTVTISAPQSISQYGTISDNENHALDDETDNSVWENFTTYSTAMPGTNSYYIDQDVRRVDYIVAMDVAMRRAQTQILSAHRDTRVYVSTFIRPEFDLRHTIYVNTDELEAKGKVGEINHELNISRGEARTTTTLVLSKANGSVSPDTLAIPSAPSDNVTFPTGFINLGNHFGENPTQDGSEDWTGMVGNRWVNENNNLFKTDFPESFTVATPDIPDNLRNAKTLAAAAVSYNIQVPDDTLVITFDGKS